MKIFVTGAAGYIGGTVVRHALALGHDVMGLVRSDASADSLRQIGCQVVVGDLTDPTSIVDDVARCEAVVHTAVGSGGQVTDADHQAVATMVGAVSGRDVPFVLTSGLAVYAGVRVGLIDENTSLAEPIPPQRARVALEDRVIAAEGAVRPVVIRPSHVYGSARSGAFTQALVEASRQRGAGVHIGDGLGWYGAVHVDDLAAAFMAALSDGNVRGSFNVVGQHITLLELATAIGHAVGMDGRTASLSHEEAATTFGPLASALTGAPPVSGVKTSLVLNWTPSNPTLVHELVRGSLRTT